MASVLRIKRVRRYGGRKKEEELVNGGGVAHLLSISADL